MCVFFVCFCLFLFVFVFKYKIPFGRVYSGWMGTCVSEVLDLSLMQMTMVVAVMVITRHRAMITSSMTGAGWSPKNQNALASSNGRLVGEAGRGGMEHEQ